MLSPLRNRFGIPGVISVVALVFAMLGGAYAANNSSDGGATASAKAKRGPKGPKGATGPAGPAGPQGAAGAKGDAGANGSNGAQGAQGLPGKSVAVADYVGVNCATATEEGVSVEVEGTPASKKYVCDGEEGPPGTPGTPGTDGEPWVVGQAPSGAELKGTWAVHSSDPATDETLRSPISFLVPVDSSAGIVADIVPAGGPDPFEAVFGGPVCTGNSSNPTGATGPGAGQPIVCVYVESKSNITLPANPLEGAVGVSDGGLIVLLKATEGAPAHAFGSWAYIVP